MMFSNQLSRLRKEMKITQELLAEKCDVSRQAVAKWESGESLPSIYKLIEIAELFNVSLDELFEMTYDFGEYSGDVLKKYKYEISDGPAAYQRYCEGIIPKMYDRIEEILGEYLAL